MYIPKNRIKTNLYTRGNEYQNKETKVPYIGHYWTMYNGTTFTGKNPNEKPQIELEVIQIATDNIWQAESTNEEFQQYVDTWDSEVVPGQMQNLDMITTYNFITETDIASVRYTPQQYYPTPTEEEYELGVFTRYFACKINEPSYLELNKKTYDKMRTNDPEIVWVIYKIFKIQWTLKGITSQPELAITNANSGQIRLIEERKGLKGFDEFLNSNYLEFYVEGINEVLMSNGDGLVLPDGTAYIGEYHIMADGTPMTGRSHNKGNNIVLEQIYD